LKMAKKKPQSRDRESYLVADEGEPKSRWMEQRMGSRATLGFAK